MVSLVIWVSQVGGTHITSDMCFKARGTHITSDMGFQVRGTHIISDIGFPGRGTGITRICVNSLGTDINRCVVSQELF